MEYAIYKGKKISASNVAENYEFETEIRIASANKMLFCPDTECDNRVLRYCHGDEKEAYFAHLNNANCDYANFDRENTQKLRLIRRKLYNHFKQNGYKIDIETKIIPHHYTHIVFSFPNDEKIAIELGTHQTTAKKMEYLNEQYSKYGIQVKWIVIGKQNFQVKENKVFYLKRFLLNESSNNDLIVIDWEGTIAAQYKIDTKKYKYNGKILHSQNYSEEYVEYAPIEQLYLENKELSIVGFYERYNHWLEKKNKAFNKKINDLEKIQKNIDKKREIKKLYSNYDANDVFEICKKCRSYKPKSTLDKDGICRECK